MPVDVNINGVENRIYPSTKIKEIKIQELSVIIFRDWEYLIAVKINPDLAEG